MNNIKLELNGDVYEFTFKYQYQITDGFICDSFSVLTNTFSKDEYPKFRVEQLSINRLNCIYRLYVQMGDTEEYKIDEFSNIKDIERDTFLMETTFRLIERIKTIYNYPLY